MNMKLYKNPSLEIVLLSEDDIVRTSISLDIGNKDDGIDQEINHPEI